MNINITNAVLNGCLCDLPNYLRNAEGEQPQKTIVLSSGEMVEQQGEPCTTVKQGNTIEWTRFSDPEQVLYENSQKPLTYYWHNNPYEKGVNILNVPLKRDTPCLVSSGPLSGCVYAWFLVGDRIIFLHAGNQGKSGSAEIATEELMKKEMADIFNGLKYALGNKMDPLQELEITPLLDILDTMEEIQRGQIIFPSKSKVKNTERKIAYMSYLVDEDFFGGCYCSITSPKGKTNISSIILEAKEIPSDRLFMQVHFEGNEGCQEPPNDSTSKCCLIS